MQTYSCHCQDSRRPAGTDQWRLRRLKVARGLVLLTVLGLLTAGLPRAAGAAEAEELGQLCWQFDPPFTDTLRVSVAQLPLTSPSDALLFTAAVRWRAIATAAAQTAGGPGPVTYQLLGTGLFALENSLTPTNFELGFEAVQKQNIQSPTVFGGNSSCNFFAALNLFTLNGSWRIQCTGATAGATGFTNSGTLTFQSAGCPNAQF
jgi:hypothetical protein